MYLLAITAAQHSIHFRQQIDIFREDLARSRRISLQQWRQRPLTEKLWEHAAAPLRGQL